MPTRSVTTQEQASQYARSLIEASLDPLVTISPEGKITDINEGSIKVTGISREKLVGTDFSDYFTEPEKAREGYRQVFAKGFVTDYPLTIRHKDGKLTDVLYNASVYKDVDGQVLGVFAAARDITAQKRAEKALANQHQIEMERVAELERLVEVEKANVLLSNEVTERKRAEASLRRLASVVIDSNDAITVQDLEGKISAWNRGAEKMYGYSTSEAQAVNIQETIPEAKRQETLEFMKRVLEEKVEVPSFETQRVTKDGRTLDVWMTVTRLLDESGDPVGIATTERDITERKRTEERLTEEKKNLEKVNLELDSFVYTASHDLRAPLRAISSFASFLEEDNRDQLDESGRDHLMEIRKGVNRMTKLIDDLLTLSKISRLENPYEIVDMNSLVEAARRRIEFDLRKNNTKLTIQSNLPPVYCDRIKMEEVFVNLLNNAVKFSSKSGRVPEIEVGYLETDGEHQFYITDNGIGIEKRFHEQIFGLFKRLHTQEVYEGTGAGLNIVKRIIEDHKGRVWVDSEPGKGAKFIFSISKTPKTNGGAIK